MATDRNLSAKLVRSPLIPVALIVLVVILGAQDVGWVWALVIAAAVVGFTGGSYLLRKRRFSHGR